MCQIGETQFYNLYLNLVLEPFPIRGMMTHRPRIGYPIMLRCMTPNSFPLPQSSWIIINGTKELRKVELSERVSMDLNSGKLDFRISLYL